MARKKKNAEVTLDALTTESVKPERLARDVAKKTKKTTRRRKKSA